MVSISIPYKAVRSINVAPIKESKYQDIKLGARFRMDKYRSVESSDPNVLFGERVLECGLCGWNDGGSVPPRVSIFKDFNALALSSNTAGNNLTDFLPQDSREEDKRRISNLSLINTLLHNGNLNPFLLEREEKKEDLSTK